MGVWVYGTVDAHGQRFSQWRRSAVDEDLPGPDKDGILEGRCVCCNERVANWDERPRYDAVATPLLPFAGSVRIEHNRALHMGWRSQIGGAGAEPTEMVKPPARAAFGYDPDRQ